MSTHKGHLNPSDVINKHILSFFPLMQWPENTQEGKTAEIWSPLATVSDVTHIWIMSTVM